jgi:hypothetical protein
MRLMRLYIQDLPQFAVGLYFLIVEEPFFGSVPALVLLVTSALSLVYAAVSWIAVEITMRKSPTTDSPPKHDATTAAVSVPDPSQVVAA